MFDQTHLDRKGSGSGGHVAAVALVVDLGLAHDGLTDDVIDVDAGPVALVDDDDLIVAGNAAAQTVDLLGVGAAHRLNKNVIPLFPGRQVFAQEHAAFRCAAAHEYTGELPHKLPSFRLIQILVNGGTLFLTLSNHKAIHL